MSQPIAPPRVSPTILRGFRWYIRRYLRKSFHAVGVAEPLPEPPPPETPLVVYLNHASWWDPLVAMLLSDLATPDRTLYAPFDEAALDRYPIFEKLGFFGVCQSSRRGAAQFLQIARCVLEEPGASLWMTPEGRFVDPRAGAVPFEPGLAHLADRLAAEGRDAVFLSLAMEYPFWEERLPEALCRFGEPVRLADHQGLDKAGWSDLFNRRLRACQAELATASVGRDPEAFRVLLGGSAGVGGLYEPVRWLNAKLRGREYRASHSDKLREAAGGE